MSQKSIAAKSAGSADAVEFERIHLVSTAQVRCSTLPEPNQPGKRSLRSQTVPSQMKLCLCATWSKPFQVFYVF